MARASRGANNINPLSWGAQTEKIRNNNSQAFRGHCLGPQDIIGLDDRSENTTNFRLNDMNITILNFSQTVVIVVVRLFMPNFA